MDDKKNKVGRPPEEGLISDKITTSIFLNSPFPSESELADYIEFNLPKICDTLFLDKYKSHERESYISHWRVPSIKRKTGNRSRVDFKVEGNNGNYLIECKNPKSVAREINRSIAQMLDYVIAAEEYGVKIKEYWILTTRYHETMGKIINRFDLPINVCVLNKENQAIFRHKTGVKRDNGSI